MPLSEDLSVFFGDFDVTCTSGAITGLGILDMPTEIVADGVVLTTDYRLTCLASDFGSLTYSASITVGGTAYTVRETTLVDDGKFCVLMLSKA
jgi:hypothetical protein